jgi:hypothetical protein
MAPLRLVVVLAAAGSVAAAGRLWVSALTPERPAFVAQAEPSRIVDERPLRVEAAPGVVEAAQARFHSHTPRRSTVTHAQPQTGGPATVSFRPSAPRASAPQPASAPAPGTPKPVPAPPKRRPPAPGPKPPPTTPPTTPPAPPVPPTSPPAPPTAPPAPPTTPPTTPPSATPAPPVTFEAPPPEPPAAPPPAPGVSPPAQTTRPGHGYGDTNHVHTGPPGH